MQKYGEIDPKLYESYETVQQRTLGDFEREELKTKPVYKGKTIDQLSTHDKLELANIAFRQTEQKLISVFKDFNKIQEEYNKAKEYKRALEAEVNREVTSVMKEVAQGVAQTMVDIQKDSTTETTEEFSFEKKDEEKT